MIQGGWVGIDKEKGVGRIFYDPPGPALYDKEGLAPLLDSRYGIINLTPRDCATIMHLNMTY